MKKRRSKEKLEKLLADFTESLAGGANCSMEPSFEESKFLSEKNLGADSALAFCESEDSFLVVGDPTSSYSAKPREVASLLETVRTISSVIQPEQPSEDFAAKVSHAVQDRFQEQISTEKIQRIIGMAVTVEGFRKSLFHDVVAACRSVGFNLTPKEIAALRNLREDAVEEFANSLDERITKFFPANLP